MCVRSTKNVYGVRSTYISTDFAFGTFLDKKAYGGVLHLRLRMKNGWLRWCQIEASGLAINNTMYQGETLHSSFRFFFFIRCYLVHTYVPLRIP